MQAVNLNPENDGSDDDHDGLLGASITSATGFTAVKFIQFPWEMYDTFLVVPQPLQYSVGPSQIDGLGNAN